MHQFKKRWFRPLLLSIIYTFGILGIMASVHDGDDDDDSSVSFPTPTLPEGATVFDALNATDVAESALSFAEVLPLVTGKPAEAESLSIGNILKVVTDPDIWRNRISSSRVAATDLNNLCSTGSVTGDLFESGNEIEGTISYNNCDLFGFGIIVNGTISVFEIFDDGAATYDFQIGGTLTITVAPDTVTVVLNISQSGNLNTLVYNTDNISYSVAGLPDETYLVTTAQALIGNFGTGLNSGQLIVMGGANTRLRLDVVLVNMVDVYLDTGSGTFVYHSTVIL